jgi:hypothetical protein
MQCKACLQAEGGHFQHQRKFVLLFIVRIFHQEGPRKPGGTEIKWDTSAAGLCRWWNLLGDNIDATKKNMEPFIEASKEVGLEVNTGKLSICYCLVTRMQGKVTT